MNNEKQLPFRNIKHSGNKLITQVNNVPAEAAKSISDLFYMIADELKDIHETYEYRRNIEKMSKKHLFELKQIPIKLEEKMSSGMSFEQALEYLNNYEGIRNETIYSYWLSHIKSTEENARLVRNRQIIEYHNKGISTQVIADIVELSSRSVQRIIRDSKASKQDKLG